MSKGRRGPTDEESGVVPTEAKVVTEHGWRSDYPIAARLHRGTPVSLRRDPRTSLEHASKDPEEGPLLWPFLNAPSVTEQQRGAYRDFLLQRGDLRGELLALADELRAVASSSSPDLHPKRARLRQLIGVVDQQWWASVQRRDELRQLNCGFARREIPVVRFAYHCPTTWEELEPTAEQGVRHCLRCNERVHHAEGVAEAESLARAGKCVSIATALVDTATVTPIDAGSAPRPASGRTIGVVWHPEDPLEAWGRRIFSEGK